MQERVLGSLIIGGIACVGVVWALIDGVPSLVKAKNSEKQLEATLVSRVASDFNISVDSLDVKKVSYSNEIVKKTNKFGVETSQVYALIAMEGYTNDNQNFKIEVLADTQYIRDLSNKVGNSSLTSAEALRYDIYQNYTMTSADLLNTILADTSTQVRGYYIGKQTYARLYADEGTRIVTVGDPFIANGMPNNPYNIEEVIKLAQKDGATNISQKYIYGSISSDITSKDNVNPVSGVSYKSYSFDLTYENPKTEEKFTVSVVDTVLSTGINNLEKGDTVVIRSGIAIENGKPVLKEFDLNGKTVGCLVDSVGEPTTIDQLVITTDAASALITDLSYGEILTEQSYVYGTVASITAVEDENKVVSYNIRLVTKVDNVEYYFEVYKATFDKTNVLETEVNVGDTIACKGYLTSNLYYELAK